jgi:rubrerythrin
MRKIYTLRKNVLEDRVFAKDKVVKWHCRNCGYIHEGTTAPEKCPACAHPKAYFEVLAVNFNYKTIFILGGFYEC